MISPSCMRASPSRKRSRNASRFDFGSFSKGIVFQVSSVRKVVLVTIASNV